LQPKKNNLQIIQHVQCIHDS